MRKLECGKCGCELEYSEPSCAERYTCGNCKYLLCYIEKTLFYFEYNCVINNKNGRMISSAWLTTVYFSNSNINLKYYIIPKIKDNIVDISSVESRVKACLIFE